MRRVPANYIYAKSLQPGYWTAVYIGECEDIDDRCSNHHKASCISENGATHIFTHIASEDRDVRLAEETDLRKKYKTSCNDQ